MPVKGDQNETPLKAVTAFGLHCAIYPGNSEKAFGKVSKEQPLIYSSELRSIYPKREDTPVRFVVRTPLGRSPGIPEIIWGKGDPVSDKVYAHTELVNPSLRTLEQDMQRAQQKMEEEGGENILDYMGNSSHGDFVCLAAGEVFFNKKHEIVRINNKSGGFKPRPECLHIALAAMCNDGLKFSDDFEIAKKVESADTDTYAITEGHKDLLKARQVVIQHYIAEDAQSKLSRFLKENRRKDDLDTAIAALDAHISALGAQDPKKNILETYSSSIKIEKAKIPNRELPAATELTNRILFYAKNPLHEANNTRTVALANRISKRSCHKYGYIALAVLGISVALFAVAVIMASTGGAGILAAPLLYAGLNVTATAITAAIGVTGVAELAAVSVGLAAATGVSAVAIHRAHTTNVKMAPVASTALSDLGLFSKNRSPRPRVNTQEAPDNFKASKEEPMARSV